MFLTRSINQLLHYCGILIFSKNLAFFCYDFSSILIGKIDFDL